MKTNTSRNDRALIITLLAVAAAVFIIWFLTSRMGGTVLVTVDGAEYARLPLDKSAVLVIESEGGTNTLTIKDGKADMTEASCPDHICVDHYAISRTGETIICLPNKVVVSIEGAGESGADLNT